MTSREAAEAFLASLRSAKLVQCQSLIQKVKLALNRNQALEDASQHLANRLMLDFQGGPQTDLFHDLLSLLESVEQADIKVAHFDKTFTPIVGRLLQFQANVRALFKWDHDETVTEAGFRPLLVEVERIWEDIAGEAERTLKLSQSFLKSVAYIASAFAVIEQCESWRTALGEIVSRLRHKSAEKVAIAILRKQISQWNKLQAVTPFADMILEHEITDLDDWEQQVSVILGRSKQRIRAPLAEAENILKLAPSPLGVNSQDFESLAQQVEIAQKIRTVSFETIARSYQFRTTGSAGYDNVDPETQLNWFLGELANLSKESRGSVIDSGVTMYLETELRILRIEALFRAVLNRPHVVPLDLLSAFIDQTAVFCNTVETGWEHPVDRSQYLRGVEFFPNGSLVEACKTRIAKTLSWKHVVADFLVNLPAHHEAAFAASLSAGSKKTGALTAMLDQPLPHELGVLESMISQALGAPPTAAGEKILDVVVRNLEKELPAMDLSAERPKVNVPEYVYPLPLYQLPPTPASTPVPGAVQPARGRGAKVAAQAPVPPENPLLMKGLSPMHQLLYQVPWVRPGMAYLSPLNEVMMRRPPEWVAAEHESFKEKLSRPGLQFKSALELIVEHKRNALLQTPEYVKMRSFAATSLRTVRTCMNKFSFLAARNKHEETEVPVEHWEKILQPTSGGNEGLDEGAPVVSSAPPSAQKENEEVELVGLLLQLEGLAFQVPTKFRLLMLMLDMYDWRVKSQCVCHHMGKNRRPRPWTADERSLTQWAMAPPLVDIFGQKPVPQNNPTSDPLCVYIVPQPPPKQYVLCSMHMSFFYVIECCRHFIRVMSDMCELCFNVTTTDQEEMFWISCDACDKWFHGRCAGVNQQVQSFTCPHCTLANDSATQDRKRLAMNVLQSQPPKKFQPIEPPVRAEEAVKLLNEAKQQQIIVTCNPVEVGIFKRLVPENRSQV
jgi:hypothetical protein